MLLLLQIILCCLLYLALVKCAVRDSGRNCLYFYPDAYLDEAQRRGIADKTEELRKGKRFMTFFCLVIFVVLIAVIAEWNGVKDFKTASFETYLFLMVVNWFDGFVIDLLWVGHSKIWRIEGMEGVPYVKLWRTVYTKRSAATALYLLVAAAVGGIVVLIGKICQRKKKGSQANGLGTFFASPRDAEDQRRGS